MEFDGLESTPPISTQLQKSSDKLGFFIKQDFLTRIEKV